MDTVRLLQIYTVSQRNKYSSHPSLSYLFFLPGMLKDVEDELQRKVKVFVLVHFKLQSLTF